MIPEARTLIERIAATQYSVITERGGSSPYTFDKLYKVPKEHTAEGLGEKFQKYLDELTAKRKQLNLWKVVLFFKWELIQHTAWFFLTH